MTDTPALPAAPAAPSAPSAPSITFGEGAGAPPKTPPASLPPTEPSTTTDAPDKFEFTFDGDNEKYSFEEKTDDTQVAESYDASKPFDPRVEEALKDLPDLLKSQKQGHYELRQWKGSGFKTPAEVKAYRERVEKLGGPEAIEQEATEWAATWSSFQAGDPGVIEEWGKENPEGLTKLSGPMLDWLHKTNPGVWAAHMSKVFMSTLLAPNAQGVSTIAAFNQLYDIPEVANSPAAQKLLKQIAETINGVSETAKKGDLTAAANDSGTKKEAQKLAQEKHGLFLEKVNMKASPAVDSGARQAMKIALKGLTLTKEAEADVVSDIRRQFNVIQKADPIFQKNAKDLLQKQDTDGFLKVLKSAIARNMPRAALREARKYKGLSGNNAARKAEAQTRVESGGGGATASNRVRYTGPMIQGGPDPAQIDYAGMRAIWGRKGCDEHLSNHEFLKKGGDQKVIYFW